MVSDIGTTLNSRENTELLGGVQVRGLNIVILLNDRRRWVEIVQIIISG